MWRAAEEGDAARVRDFLARGNDPNERGRYRETALCRATEHGHHKVALLLLIRGASVDDNYNRDGRTALHNAAEQGHEAVVELLLEFGASRTVLDYSSRTAEAYASEKGHFAIVNLISKWEYLPGLNAASMPITASPSASACVPPEWAASLSASPGKNNETCEATSGGGKLEAIGKALKSAQASLQELSESVEGLDALLECPVCLVIPRMPVQVLQCAEGHVVCSTCKTKLSVCAQCKTFLGASNVVRNRRMEDVIEKVKSMAI